MPATNQQPKNQQLWVNVSKRLATRLENAARYTGLSEGEIIRLAILRYVEAVERKGVSSNGASRA